VETAETAAGCDIKTLRVVVEGGAIGACCWGDIIVVLAFLTIMVWDIVIENLA